MPVRENCRRYGPCRPMRKDSVWTWPEFMSDRGSVGGFSAREGGRLTVEDVGGGAGVVSLCCCK